MNPGMRQPVTWMASHSDKRAASPFAAPPPVLLSFDQSTLADDRLGRSTQRRFPAESALSTVPKGGMPCPITIEASTLRTR